LTLGTAINLVAVLGPVVLWIGLDRWLQWRGWRLPRWSCLVPTAWALISGWLVYSCTLIDNCS
jgi:hypothetical protein